MNDSSLSLSASSSHSSSSSLLDDTDALGDGPFAAATAAACSSKTEVPSVAVSGLAFAAGANYYLEQHPAGAVLSPPPARVDWEDVFGAHLRQVFDPAACVGRRGRPRGRRPAARLSDSLVPLLGAAHSLFVENRLDEAIAQCHQMVQLDPKAVAAYKTLSLIHATRGELSTALDYGLIAAHLHPHDNEWWKHLGYQSVRLGKPRQAIYCFAEALRAARGTDREAYRQRAHLYALAGDDGRAVTHLDRVLRHAPDDEASAVLRAQCLMRRGQVPEAETSLRQWLEQQKGVGKGEMDKRRRRRQRQKLVNGGASSSSSSTPTNPHPQPLLPHVRAYETLCDALLAQGKHAQVIALLTPLKWILCRYRARQRQQQQQPATPRAHLTPMDDLPLRLQTRLVLAQRALGDQRDATAVLRLLADEARVPLRAFHDVLYAMLRGIVSVNTAREGDATGDGEERRLVFHIARRLLTLPPYHQDGLVRRAVQLEQEQSPAPDGTRGRRPLKAAATIGGRKRARTGASATANGIRE
ncbi:hypothetical protein CDCA_CDCA20G4764 [Cyanidium caldarium]|uniref:Uncharacterized protein n=1 Tax=Cyanidium caldarium TaxID=2771 RepID=A0AAV9J2M9_CYACA|nr:hypothetical protein CDCA_CDCA20G4764 [Cyanidium caldarium]